MNFLLLQINPMSNAQSISWNKEGIFCTLHKHEMCHTKLVSHHHLNPALRQMIHHLLQI